jgi:hypothetical protein
MTKHGNRQARGFGKSMSHTADKEFKRLKGPKEKWVRLYSNKTLSQNRWQDRFDPLTIVQ